MSSFAHLPSEERAAIAAPPPPPTPGPIAAPSAPAPVQTALVQPAMAALAPPPPIFYAPPPGTFGPPPPTTISITPAQIAATMPTPPAIGASSSTPTVSTPSPFKGTTGPLPSDYYTDASLADWKQDLRPDPPRQPARGAFAVLPGGSSLAAPAAAASTASEPLEAVYRGTWTLWDPSTHQPWTRLPSGAKQAFGEYMYSPSGNPGEQGYYHADAFGRAIPIYRNDWETAPEVGPGYWKPSGSTVAGDSGGSFAFVPSPPAPVTPLPPASSVPPSPVGGSTGGQPAPAPFPAGTPAARFRAAPGAGPAAGATGWGSFAGAELAPSPARAVQPRSSYGAGPATINLQPQASWARYAVTVPTPIRTGEVGGFRSVPAAGAVGAYFGGGSLRRY